MTKAHRMFELVREQSVGTQSICFFCAGKGIKPTTFHYWKRKYDDLHAPTSDGFIDIAAHYQGAPQPIDIIYPNGVNIHLESIDLPLIAQLIRIA